MIESRDLPQWNGETGVITDVVNGHYLDDGRPCQIATVKFDRIAWLSARFALDELRILPPAE